MAGALVVYSSWTGATRTVAESIGDTLRGTGTGTDVTVSRAGKVNDLNQYDAVIVGTSVHIGRFPSFKVPVKAMSQQPDHRDWEAIRAWIESVAPMLLPDDQ